MALIFSMALMLAAAAPPVEIAPLVVTEKDYPGEARRRDIQGDAEYMLDVDPSGRPTACRITSSASNDALDRATCVVAMRARFRPAADDNGQPIAGQFTGWRRWNLQDATPARAEGHSVDVAFDGEGRVTKCRVNRIVPTAILTIDILRRCNTMGNSKVFTDFLGRPTTGLKSAAIRTYTTIDKDEHFDRGADTRHVLAAVEYDQTRSGPITRCRTIQPSIVPGAAPGRDLCGPGGFAVSAGAGKQPTTTRWFTIDAVSTVAR